MSAGPDSSKHTAPLSPLKRAALLVYVLAFFGLCLVPTVSMLTGVGTPAVARQQTARMPELVDDSGLNTDFPSQFDDFFESRYGFRSWLITTDAVLLSTLLGQSNNHQVVMGRRGWLFFREEMDDYLRRDPLSAGEVERLVRILEIQHGVLSARGIPFIVAVAPNKSTIYGENVPSWYAPLPVPSTREMLGRALAESELTYLDLAEPLLAAKRDELLYHRDDSHWNNTGALVTVETLLDAVEAQVLGYVSPDFPHDYHVTHDWHGDLAAMVYPATTRLDRQTVYALEPTYRFTRPMRSPEDMRIITTKPPVDSDLLNSGMSSGGPLNSGMSSRGLLIFRDSFCNAWIPFLSSAFDRVHYSRAVPRDYRLLASEQPEVVVLEVVERNLPLLLERAPILPAPLAAMTSTSADAAREDEALVATLRHGVVAPYVWLYGYLETPWERSGETTEIPGLTIRLRNGDIDLLLRPFPVLESSLFEAVSDLEVPPLGFSLFLDPEGLPPGVYDVEVLITDHDGVRGTGVVGQVSVP